MKYKLINITTKKETLCDKVTVDGFDYYVNDDEFDSSKNYFIDFQDDRNSLHQIGYDLDDDGWIEQYDVKFFKKVIACNNPNIDVPQVVVEVERLKFVYNEGENKDVFTIGVSTGIEIGYSKAKETYSFSEEDVIFMLSEAFKASQEGYQITSKQIIQLCKEQQTRIVYYGE